MSFKQAGRLLIAFAAIANSFAQTPRRNIVQLNQGWSQREVEFYNHASEGTNLAPLEFVLNLPDPARPTTLFKDKLAREYGFIPSEKSELNPYGLPVGFAIDERPKAMGDRPYLGLTCAACHTRQLTYGKWILPVHGGPALVDMPRFKQDLFDAFGQLLTKPDLASRFARGVLQHAPSADETQALLAEVREFTGPIALTAKLQAGVNMPNFGPGNLNALSQGNYNNAALVGWFISKGLMPPSPTPPLLPAFEGSVNYPSMWFAPHDDWAQWFAGIDDPGPRNWIQSVSTSEVRPPKMIAALGPRSLLASIHFDNIAGIQRSLELLRTPQWPEEVLGSLKRNLVKEGKAIYDEQCKNCHFHKPLPPNSLGVVFTRRPAVDVGTDPTAYKQFAVNAADRVEGLKRISSQIIALRTAQLQQQVGAEQAENYLKFYSKGRPNEYRLAQDDYLPDVKTPKSGASYWASPMEGIFASSPYLHNGSVRTLWDLLTPPEKRPKKFHTGSAEYDVEGVGLKDSGLFLYDTSEPGKSNAGHEFGTELSMPKKMALVEYLKSI